MRRPFSLLRMAAWTLGAWAAWCGTGTAWAQLVISDTLNGRASSYNWLAINGACLTAGDGTGSIPACAGLPYYGSAVQVGGATGRLPDTPGQGALRLTNGDRLPLGWNGDNQNGAVVSNFTFPSHQGLEVTFTTMTYGGDGLLGTGADGMSFFLMDGAQPPAIGALGGSLGYSCSNINSLSDGVRRGYLGVGIDEFGNFSSPWDNTNSGPGFRAGRISLRGAGDTAWASLNARYPRYYPAGLSALERAEAVRRTCATGYLHNYSGAALIDRTGRFVLHWGQTGESAGPNYPLVAHSDLPDGVTIANQQGMDLPLRRNATPITYVLKITQDGKLNFAYSINGGFPQQVINDRLITQDNGPLPATFRFGFSAGTGSGSNVHEISCFKAAPVEQSQSSAGTNVQQSARVEAGTQLYLAFYHPVNWWGELTANNLLVDDATGAVSIDPTSNWNAHCVLTGGPCESTGRTQAAQSPDSRRMLTWNGSRGVPFQWSRLSAAQRTALSAGDATATDLRLRYLRGDRSREIANGGSLRTRQGVLGDIVHSGPTWVGPPSSPYAGPWTDALFPAATAPESRGPSYASFQRAAGTRQNLVYVGANDGWLHGFRAGGHDASGHFVANAATPNDGQEMLAYMPAAVLQTLHSTTPSLDYSSPQYSHNFHVDATPGSGDLYYAGAWHTWLVSGLGPGGNAGGPVGSKTGTAAGALFALDITDPDRFAESNAAALVVGEWSSASLTCTNVDACGRSLGSSFGTPVIRRLHSGNWAVLFGNGLSSASGTAGLYIMMVDALTGATTFRFIDTGHGPARDPERAGAKNGIAHVTAADLDGDHITDFVYGGDVFGNVWRFDLTSNNPAAWTASSEPVFATGGRPISTRIAVASVPGTGTAQPRVVLGFGTGRQMVQTLTSAASHAGGTHALYGVWDWNLEAWNRKAGAGARYAALAGPQAVTPGDLAAQSVLTTVAGGGAVSGYRTVSRSKVCWKGSVACTSGNTQFGWMLALPGAGEQVIYNPVLAYGMLVVNTTIPEIARPLSCEVVPPWGYTMAVTMADGGAPGASFFADANNEFVSYDGEFVAGIGLGAVGSPYIVTTLNRPYLVQQTVKGAGTIDRINPTLGGSSGRLTWVELR
jgi:type IV pilus assembly protein PilY1